MAVQKLAHCAFLHHSKEGLIGLAALGSFGEHQGNVKRDLLRFLEQSFSIHIPSPFGVRALCLDPHNSHEDWNMVYINSPDDIFAGLHKYGNAFEELFSTGKVVEFWNSVKPDDPKLRALLLETGLQRQDLAHTIPLTIHGDGVEFQNNDSLMTFHISSVLNVESSLQSCILLAAYPKSCTSARTWEPVWQQLVRGFKNLMMGTKSDELLAGMEGSDLAN